MKTSTILRSLTALFVALALQAVPSAAASSLGDKLVPGARFKEPLYLVSDAVPDEGEASALAVVLNQAAAEKDPRAQVALIESFIQNNPNSPWTPSLRFQLGLYYRDRGRVSLALMHWEGAWAVAKGTSGNGAKAVAGQVVLPLGKLLLALGHDARLAELLRESRACGLTGVVAGAVDDLATNTADTVAAGAAAGRCGLAALVSLAEALGTADEAMLARMRGLPAKGTGLSLADLGATADSFGLGLQAVRVKDFVPVPALVHCQQQHFAAVLGKDGPRYQVADGLDEQPRWMREEDLLAEMSGACLVPANAAPTDAVALSATEAATFTGRGYPNTIDDTKDWFVGGGAGYGSPQWKVTEPFINLNMELLATAYPMADGASQRLGLFYKQRGVTGTNLWANTWSGYVDYFYNYEWEMGGYLRGVISVKLPDGGARFYYSDGVPREVYDSKQVIDGGTLASPTATYRVSYADGRLAVFSYQQEYLLGYVKAYLTAAYDFLHRSTTVTNETVNGVVRAKSITDYEKRTTTFKYDATHPERLTEVVDPYRLTNRFEYNASGQLVTNRFATNLWVAFQYDDKAVVTNLITLYGNTGFKYTVNTNTGNVVKRSMQVTLPTGARELYLYRDQSTKLNTNSVVDLLPFSYPANEVPSTAPFTNTFDNTWMDARNTFFWSMRAYASLSAQFRSSGNFDDLTLDDYRLASLTHWMRYNNQAKLGHRPSLVRGGSADGVTEGPKTWFDYPGKVSVVETNQGQVITNWYSMAQSTVPPRFIARILPNGESSFNYTAFNTAFQPTNAVSTYSDGATVRLRTNSFVYDASYVRLLRQYGPMGELVRSNTWTTNNLLVTTANALGETTAFTYKSSSPYQLTSVRLPNGLVTTNEYYTTGQTNFLWRTTVPDLGVTNSCTYTNFLVYTATDERGNVITNQYDALRRPVATSSAKGTGRVVYTNLLVAYTVDVLSNTNRFGYDAYGRKVWDADPLNRTNQYEYCDCGALSAVTDAIGQWVRYYYDNLGRVVTTLAHDGFTVTNAYDALGRVVVSGDSSGAISTNAYNHQGLVYAVSNKLGRLAYSQFDIWDRATNAVDINGIAVGMQYDLLGRVTKTTYGDGSFDALGYSATIAAATSATNRLGDVTRFGYDVAGRKTVETNALSQVTSFAYGISGELLSLTDGKSNITRWAYDHFARMTSKTNASGTQVLALAYDPVGRVTNRWTPAKGNVVYRYDAVGNLTNVDYAASTDVALQYDALNRLTNRVDAVGTTRFSYNASGLPESEDGPWADDTVSYSYTQRRLTGLSLLRPSASAWTQSFGYDPAQRLTNIVTAAGTFGYAYEAGRPGLLNRQNLPGGSHVDYTYDALARATNIACLNAAAQQLDRQIYALNQGDQITRHTRKNGDYVDYTYDKTGQLVSAKGKEAGGVTNRLHEQMGYAYDAAGNLNYRTNNALTQTFGVNARNELTTLTRSGSYTVAGTTADGTTTLTVNFLSSSIYGDLMFASAGHNLADGTNTFTTRAYGSGWAETNTTAAFLPATVSHVYDANGNLTSDGVRGYEYDDENQLVRITQTNAWKSEFTYDGAQRRRVRKEYTWSGSWVLADEVRYVYDGNLVLQERSSANTPRFTYTRGKDLSGSLQGAGGVGGMLAREDHTNGTPTWAVALYVGDGKGNICSLVSTGGVVVAHYLYDPYGNVLAKTGPLADANLYQFSSKEVHAASGLVYFGRRYYSPALQRWINQDPLEEADGPNLYSYVGNAPVFSYDAWGLSQKPTPSPGVGEFWRTVFCNADYCRPPKKDAENGGGGSGGEGGGTASSNGQGQSKVGNALRNIPIIGGLLGGVADILSGALNMSLGVVTFGQSGTLGSGLSQIGHGMGGGMMGALDIAGKAWNAPNTAIGLAWGGLGYGIGKAGYALGLTQNNPKITLGNNAIQFENHPFMFGGDITIGNTIHYNSIAGPNVPLSLGSLITYAMHEIQHTYQGQILGPLYLPANLIGGVASIIAAPRGTQDAWHYKNFMETPGDIPWPGI